jgi:hypothetical protein
MRCVASQLIRQYYATLLCSSVLLPVLFVLLVMPDAMLVEQHEGRIAATCTCTGTRSFYTNTGDIAGKCH